MLLLSIGGVLFRLLKLKMNKHRNNREYIIKFTYLENNQYLYMYVTQILIKLGIYKHCQLEIKKLS